MRALTIIKFVIVILLMRDAWAAGIKRTEVVGIDDSTDITISIYPGPADFLVLWIPPEYGIKIPEAKLAEYLGAGQNEVWIADFLGARFLPPAPSSLRGLPAEDVATVIEEASTKTGKFVFLASTDHGAGLALRGAAVWRVRYPDGSTLAGAILWHPQLYVDLPQPGKDARYIDQVSRITLPIFIFQPKLSPGRWRLNRLISAFAVGKSPVFAKLIPGVRDRFFLRGDPNPREESMATMVYKLHQMAVSQLRSGQWKGQ